jgi:hypothetical protein
MNRKNRLIKIAILLLVVLLSKENTISGASLDIGKYLQIADSGKIYPSAKQIELLKAVMPEKSFQPAPPITDRAYWAKIATSKSGKEYLKNALLDLDKKPEVPISDETYREANKKGNRGMYKPRYYRTMDRLEHFMLAECIENQGRFLPQVAVYLRAIMDMKSWMHPNHDDSENSVLEGKRVAIDLGARKFSADLALAEVLLGAKLSNALRKEISTQLRWRITESYFKSCRDIDTIGNSWIRSTSNWNAVCTSGTIYSILATSGDANERLAAVGCALNSMKYYLSGFGSDGYCSEGIGYWSYGFGHYLYLAQILYDYSNGQIDLFAADNPVKLKNVANFPENFQIQNNLYAPFSDGNISAATEDGNFPYVMSALHYGAQKPSVYKYEEAFEQLIDWTHSEQFTNDGTAKNATIRLPKFTYFDDFGMVISRGKQKNPFSIAIKAGHNAENHNHSDVGTYTIVLDKDIVVGDIGAPSYIAGAFSPDNPARSSWGHPVPRLDKTLQSNGRQFCGTITATGFTESNDKIVMDIKAAYEFPPLQSLVRTMENNKNGSGTITIEDKFSATKPFYFGTAIMTFSKYEIVNSNTLIITSANQKVKVEIMSQGALVKINPESVPVAHLRNGKDAIRIGLDLTEPIMKGSISIRYTPIL